MRRLGNVLLAAAVLSGMTAMAGVFVSITVAPPALPVYVQPPCPTPGFLWTPGYWAYGAAGYYWVPGVWVAPPRPGLLWTPGYWGFASGIYGWHAGYWGPHVGFYGGVNYGFGFSGVGFSGGVWAGNVFRYNTAVSRVDTTVIHNTYINRTVVNNVTVNRTSFNGPGGVTAQPTVQERAAMSQQHFQPTANQVSHQQTASQNRGQLASVNGGRPQNVAMNRVNGRADNQQARIAQGDRNGQLTPRETARADTRQASIDRQVANERRQNGGRLTPQERQNVNRRQNNASRQIEHEKHDGARDHEHR